MSRDNSGTPSETRSSALWGTGNRGGDSRANALWGKGGRGFIAILSVLFVAAIPLAGGAVKASTQDAPTYVDPVLLAKAQMYPDSLTRMIIQSSDDADDASKAFRFAARQDASPDREQVKDEFRFVNSISVTLKAGKVLQLAKKYSGLTITSDAEYELAGSVTPSSRQLWPTAENVRPFYNDTEQFRAKMPTMRPTHRVTAAGTARSSQASRQAMLPTTPGPLRAPTSSRLTS